MKIGSGEPAGASSRPRLVFPNAVQVEILSPRYLDFHCVGVAGVFWLILTVLFSIAFRIGSAPPLYKKCFFCSALIIDSLKQYLLQSL